MMIQSGKKIPYQVPDSEADIEEKIWRKAQKVGIQRDDSDLIVHGFIELFAEDELSHIPSGFDISEAKNIEEGESHLAFSFKKWKSILGRRVYSAVRFKSFRINAVDVFIEK